MLITFEFVKEHLGFFDCELEAARAYDSYAKSLHGVYANQNLGEKIC